MRYEYLVLLYVGPVTVICGIASTQELAGLLRDDVLNGIDQTYRSLYRVEIVVTPYVTSHDEVPAVVRQAMQRGLAVYV